MINEGHIRESISWNVIIITRHTGKDLYQIELFAGYITVMLMRVVCVNTMAFRFLFTGATFWISDYYCKKKPWILNTITRYIITRSVDNVDMYRVIWLIRRVCKKNIVLERSSINPFFSVWAPFVSLTCCSTIYNVNCTIDL